MIIAPEENCPRAPKLILTQTPTLIGGQFSSEAIAWLPPSPKTNPNLDPNLNPTRRAIFFGGGAIFWIPSQIPGLLFVFCL